ncbi:MAG: hypothetical protein KBG39_11630 [Opitutaceae bacterium]|nr:hypothetical protein [Opitutaceae bacterium]
MPARLIPLFGGRKVKKPVLIYRVEIDAKGWLRLYPAGERYDHIYRAAAGVKWDKSGGFLHAEEPGTWPYPAYFGQIISVVASEYGDALTVSPTTEWLNVPADIRAAIQAS